MRSRTLVLCLLPAVFLGVTYFTFVEYVIREFGIVGRATALLRTGGGALTLLFALLALACAGQAADSIYRPLRSLLHFAESPTSPTGTTGTVPPRDPDLRRLFVRVLTLAQQSRAGEQTLKELEELRSSVADLDRALEEIQRALLEQEGEREMRSEDLDAAVAELERLATVWSLEVELARREDPHISGDLGSCHREITAALERVRAAGRSRSGVRQGTGLDRQIARLRETIDERRRMDELVERKR